MREGAHWLPPFANAGSPARSANAHTGVRRNWGGRRKKDPPKRGLPRARLVGTVAL